MKRIALILLTFSLVSLLSCGPASSYPVKINQSDRTPYESQCIDGVVYYLFSQHDGYRGFGFMSPKFNPDGTVSTC